MFDFSFKYLIFLILSTSIKSEAEKFCKNKYCFDLTEEPTSVQSSCSRGSWPLEFPDKEASEFFTSKANPKKIYKLNLKYESSSWEWTTRRKSFLEIENQSNENNKVACLKETIFQAKSYIEELTSFVCEVPGCLKVDGFSCFEIINKTNNLVTWYEAMNYCVERNKRLAVFEDDQVPKQLSDRLDSSKCYWIGLSKVRFTWPHYNKSLTYSSWLNGSPPHPLQSSDCFFVFQSSQWIQLPCNSNTHDVCMSESSSSLFLGLGVGLGLVTLLAILIIILALVFYKKKFKSFKTKPDQKKNKNKTQKKSLIEKNSSPIYVSVTPGRPEAASPEHLTYVELAKVEKN